MTKHIIFTSLFSLLLITTFTKPAHSADTLFFDSTNNYLGACQLTDKSTWELTEDSPVTTFQIWYSWNQNETILPVTLLKDGKEFAKFEATRSSCDPYQKQWCNADFALNRPLPKGKYSTQIPSSRQCLKPGGTGAVRLYKETAPTSTPTPTPTTPPTITTTPSPTISTPIPCSCNQTTTILTATTASLITSLLINLLLKSLKR